MLPVPFRGPRRSVKTHNSAIDSVLDWIELSLLFSSPRIAKATVSDALCQAHIYDDSALSDIFVEMCWRDLAAREKLRGYGLFHVDGKVVVRTAPWHNYPAYAFCMLATAWCWYETKLKKGDYNDQGRRCENLTAEALEAMFPGWQVHKFGWAKGRTNKISDVITLTATALGETPATDIAKIVNPMKNEEGLDILVGRPWSDGRVGSLALLVQCASGHHFEEKIHEPNMGVWKQVIQWHSIHNLPPLKAFATPFALPMREHGQLATSGGLILDRIRLLALGRSATKKFSGSLSAELKSWVQSHRTLLPAPP